MIMRMSRIVTSWLSFTLCVACPLAAQSQQGWLEPFPPFAVTTGVYYVGTKALASYLVTTPQGHVLINSGLEEGIPLLRASVERLGFRFNEIRILLISHAHWDHNAGSAAIKALTGARFMVMAGDVSAVESGGKTDFQYGNEPSMHYTPTGVDRVLYDGAQVELGGTILTAHLTPGHTMGCTTWSVRVKEADKVYNVVIVGSPNVNPGYRLIDNVRYPQIVTDYERTFRVLKTLQADIFLGAHGSFFDLEGKYKRVQQGDRAAFVDPEGYRRYVAERERAFRNELARQQARRLVLPR